MSEQTVVSRNESTATSARQVLRNFFARQEVGLLLILLAMCTFLTWQTDTFLTSRNIFNTIEIGILVPLKTGLPDKILGSIVIRSAYPIIGVHITELSGKTGPYMFGHHHDIACRSTGFGYTLEDGRHIPNGNPF